MLTFITLVNDREQLAQCQASVYQDGSPGPSDWIVVEPNPHGWNAAQGLNHGLSQARTPWIVCCHQDVLFPPGWIAKIQGLLADLPAEVAIAGLVGTRSDGRFRGHIVDPNGNCYWGPLPDEVLILDEALLVLRASAGLQFEEEVPGFHCYGADICLQAWSKGLKIMAVDAPARHLSSGRVDEQYWIAARWLLDRWGAHFGYVLPTPAKIVQDARSSWLRRKAVLWRRRLDRRLRHIHAHKGSSGSAR